MWRSVPGGHPFGHHPGAGGGISILEGYRVDRTLLTAPEMQAILAGARSLDSVSGTRRYAQLMEKLSAGSGTLVPGGATCSLTCPPGPRPPCLPRSRSSKPRWRTTAPLSFTYFAPKGTSQREVEPYYLLFHWSAWYVWAWCRTRQDFRLFKLGRMTDLSPGAPFSPRPAPPSRPGTHPRVSRHLHGDHSLPPPGTNGGWWRSTVQTASPPLPDGRPRFVGTFPDEDSILSWSLTFGDGAELLEPPALRTWRQLGGGLGPAIPRLTRPTEPKGGVPMASPQSVCRLHHRTTGRGRRKSAPKRCLASTACTATGKFFAVICEDQLFLKCTPRGGCVPPHLPKAPPYPGARDSPAGGGCGGPGPAGPPDPNHLCRPGRPTQEGKEEATHAHRL